MENADFYEAERFLKLGLYPQAFEAFMALEVGSYECSYLMPCKMALDNQLTPAQMDLLVRELETDRRARDESQISWSPKALKEIFCQGLGHAINQALSKLGDLAADMLGIDFGI